jgi:hypothetical protein
MKEKGAILKRLIEKSHSRSLNVSVESMANEEIRKRSAEGYKTLPSLVEDELLDFETIYGEVEGFFRSLPWA